MKLKIAVVVEVVAAIDDRGLVVTKGMMQLKEQLMGIFKENYIFEEGYGVDSLVFYLPPYSSCFRARTIESQKK